MKIENLKSWLIDEIKEHGFEIANGQFLSDQDVLILSALIILKDIRKGGAK